MDVDPRHLMQLSVIVEKGSFGAAADHLNMTQPGLSRNIRNLELRLGVHLFERTGRNSIPNELCLALAQQGLAIRSSKERAETIASQSTKGTTGTLRVGAIPGLFNGLLVPPLSSFLNDFPDVKVDLQIGLLADISKRLAVGHVDMFVGPLSLAHQSEGFEFSYLVDDRLGIVCRQNHPLRALKPIGPKDFDGYRWIVHPAGSHIRFQTEEALIAIGIEKFEIALQTETSQAVYGVLERTDLLAVIPILPMRLNATNDAVKKLDIYHQLFARPLGITRRINEPNKIVDVFSEYLHATFALK